MPFTPSHAVVALPFIRSPLLPAAVAIGAMTPDLPLFVRGLPLSYGRTHDLAWLPATTLLAFALLLAWRCVLRPGTRELSPRPLAVRLPPEWDLGAGGALRELLERAPARAPDRSGRPGVSWSGILLLIASLALGVATHIAWDAFTHEGRAGVEAVPLLDEQWGPLTAYRWMQHGSSAFGLVVLGVWAALRLRRRGAAAPAERLLPTWVRWAWWLALPGILAVAWAWGMSTYGPLDRDLTIAHLAYRVLPPAAAIWGALTVALCVAVQAARARRRP